MNWNGYDDWVERTRYGDNSYKLLSGIVVVEFEGTCIMGPTEFDVRTFYMEVEVTIEDEEVIDMSMLDCCEIGNLGEWFNEDVGEDVEDYLIKKYWDELEGKAFHSL